MKFEFSLLIPAGKEVVWRTAQDTSLRPSWDVRVCEYIIHGEPAAGTPISIRFRAVVRRPRGAGQFVLYDPPNQSAIRVDSIDSRLVPPGGGAWILEETPEGTRFTTRFNLREREQILPLWLLKLAVRLDTRRSLRRLRKLCMKRK
jgi:hypothetical protein